PLDDWRTALHIHVLPAMTQYMIHQHQRHHGFRNRGCPHAHAGVVAAVGHDFHRIAVDIDALAGNANAGGRLQGNVTQDILTTGNATQNPASVIAEETTGSQLIPMLLATLGHALESGTDFDAL